MNETEHKTGIVTGAYLKVGVVEITRIQFQGLASGEGVDDEELPSLKQRLLDDNHFYGFAFSSYGPQFRFSWSGGLKWSELELVEYLRAEIKAGMITTKVAEPKGKFYLVIERLFCDVTIAGVDDLTFAASEIPTGSVRFGFIASTQGRDIDLSDHKPRSFDLYLVDDHGKRVPLGRSEVDI